MIPQNVLPHTAGVNSQDHLVIGGCDTLDLAEEYGTPVYILDEATLRGQCRSFVREFQTRHPNSLIVYASKAYINPALAKIFAEEGLGWTLFPVGSWPSLIAWISLWKTYSSTATTNLPKNWRKPWSRASAGWSSIAFTSWTC